MDAARSPFAPSSFPDLPEINGVRLAACAAGVRYKGRLDLMLADFAPGTVAAGVMTKSTMAGAPVVWNREALRNGSARALVVNAGNANVFTGKRGQAAVRKTVSAICDAMACNPDEVFVCSTGTIGEYLLEDRITAKISDLVTNLSGAAWKDAAHAIMTTDTYPKGASRTVSVGGVEVTLTGIAKGSGMIAPDMATMLAYVMTDASITREAAQALIAAGADKSFNAITVDSDTSTSDTLLLFATGAAGNDQMSDISSDHAQAFAAALDDLLIDLAHQVVKDGEGAQKFIEITVSGAQDDGAARRIGLAIGNSPLVKTAIAGEDANWGRIVMAVGKSGERADRDKLDIAIGGVQITRNGEPVDGYDEAPVTEHMRGRNIAVAVDVGIGDGSATVWTCDLTHGYIDINADYRT
jgi:glutamate N-acetyltransferase/amino-acid N-acetyltransferase